MTLEGTGAAEAALLKFDEGGLVQEGRGACHTGRKSCFYRVLEP